MRIPCPERFSYKGATAAATALFIAQQMEHTNLYVSLCWFCYVLVFTAAFNIAGGLLRPVGAYIFFNGVLTALVGLCTKVALGEAADKNLAVPLLTAQVYLAGMVSMLIAAYIESRYRTRQPVIAKLFPLTDLRAAYIGSLAIGLPCLLFYQLVSVGESGSFLSAFSKADQFLPLALVLGVIYTVRSSNGRRCLGGGLLALVFFMSAEGLLGFSKQAFFTPWFCVLLGIAISRYDLKLINVAVIAIVGFVLVHYATPYSQIGRAGSQGNFVANIPVAYNVLTHMDDVLESARQEGSTPEERFFAMRYYDQTEGLLDRLEMISPDDALLNETQRDGYYGYEPAIEDAENLVPHMLWPNKPVPYFGNMYAHSIGVLSDEDVTTGVSFNVSAEMYHLGGFFSVFVIMTPILALIFLMMSRFLGSVEDNPVVVVIIITISHYAPEGGIGCVFLLITQTLIVFALAFACTYILPVVASMVETKRSRGMVPIAPLIAVS